MTVYRCVRVCMQVGVLREECATMPLCCELVVLCLLAIAKPPSLARMFQPLPQSQASHCPPDTYWSPVGAQSWLKLVRTVGWAPDSSWHG